MVEEELLEIQRRIERNVKQPKLLIRDVQSVLIDLVRARLPALSYVTLSEGGRLRHHIQVHELHLILVFVLQFGVAR